MNLSKIPLEPTDPQILNIPEDAMRPVRNFYLMKVTLKSPSNPLVHPYIARFKYLPRAGRTLYGQQQDNGQHHFFKIRDLKTLDPAKWTLNTEDKKYEFALIDILKEDIST